MRKLYILIFALTFSLALSCSEGGEKEAVLPEGHVITFEESWFEPFYATSPYSGSAVTPDYVWCDQTTSLSSEPIFSESFGYTFYGGGATVSGYSSSVFNDTFDYTQDLYFYEEASLASVVNHALVFYGNYEAEATGAMDLRPELYFADGKPRRILAARIAPTCYFLNVAINGNAFSPKLAEGDKIIVSATGYDAAGEVTGVSEFTLATYGDVLHRWRVWSLAELGSVVRVEFNIVGGPTNEYGMMSPKYFAIDDIVVGE